MTDKNYQVLDSEGKEVKTVKSLSIAKKLANGAGGSVICDGECVYQAEAQKEESVKEPVKEEQEPVKSDEAHRENSEPTPEKPVEPAEPETYRIKTLMNIRSEPSLKGKVLGLLNPGTDVKVIAVKGEWLHLVDGTFVLYDGGKYAERMCRD